MEGKEATLLTTGGPYLNVPGSTELGHAMESIRQVVVQFQFGIRIDNSGQRKGRTCAYGRLKTAGSTEYTNERPSAKRGQKRTFHTIQPGDVAFLDSSWLDGGYRSTHFQILRLSFPRRSRIFVGSLVRQFYAYTFWIRARSFFCSLIL